MRDKRSIEDFSAEELERALAVKRREERQKKMERMKRTGRVMETDNGRKQHPPASTVLGASVSPTVIVSDQRLAASYAGSGGDVPRFEDAADVAMPVSPERDRFWKRFVNQSMLLIEVAAVLGLIYLGYSLLQSIGTLERETAEAQRLADEQRVAALPTIAPTPQLRIDNVVLPGGHTSPTSPHGAQPNLNEIPANLQPLVQSQLFQPVINRAPQTDQTALRLIIPKLNLDQTIVQGTDWEALKQGIGQLQNGVTPSAEGGNLVLSAHNDIYGELFRYLDQLEAGDQFQVQTQTEVFTYEITGWEVVEPTDVHVLDSTDDPTATLISCYPYQVDNKRIVVSARRTGNV